MTDTGAAAALDPMDHFAIVIGIEKYREYTPLKSPRKDAADFIKWLTDKAGVPVGNIKLVPETSEGTPDNKAILSVFEQLGVRDRRRKGGRLYVYYAGHGLGPQFNEVSILPADAQINAEQCFGLSKWLKFFIETRFFDELIMFVDCCREQQDIEAMGLPFRPLELFKEAKGDQIDVFAMVGSSYGERSYEVYSPPRDPNLDEGAHRGLMTLALIEALNGAPGAIDPTTQTITTDTLFRYVQSRVEQEAKDRGLAQKVEPLWQSGRRMTLLAMPARLSLSLVAGPQTADKPLSILNFRTKERRQLGRAAAGERLPPVEIASDTRHHLMVQDFSWEDILDPSQMRDPHELQLP